MQSSLANLSVRWHLHITCAVHIYFTFINTVYLQEMSLCYEFICEIHLNRIKMSAVCLQQCWKKRALLTTISYMYSFSWSSSLKSCAQAKPRARQRTPSDARIEKKRKMNASDLPRFVSGRKRRWSSRAKEDLLAIDIMRLFRRSRSSPSSGTEGDQVFKHWIWVINLIVCIPRH